jgi:hypothetical protein
MVDKLAGAARLVATLLAIIAGFVAIPNFNVALVLVILGLVAGLKYTPDKLLGLLFVVVTLPMVGAALANIPAIGAQLNAVALNIEVAAASIAATVIAMRLFHNSMEDVTSVAGTDTGAKAAAA